MKRRKHRDNKISKKQFSMKQKHKSDAPKRTDLKGIVVRLYPDDNKASLMNQLGGCSRLIYNSCLADKRKAIQDKESKEEEQLFEYEMEYDFFGFSNQLIPSGSKFYLLALLNPATATQPSTGTPINQVFKQDYNTVVKLTIGRNALKNAYQTIPDLRSPKLELGLSVDLTWQQGLTFDTPFQ